MMLKLAAAVLLALPAFASAQEWDARLTEVNGLVTVFSPEAPEGVPGETDMPLQDGDRVVAAQGASAEISYDGEGVVTLEGGSDATIGSAGSELQLALGAVVAKFNKLAGREFKVRTPTAVAAVRGTEFGVEAAADGTHVGVFDEGQVAVSAGGGEELVRANQETHVAQGQRPGRPGPHKRMAARRRHLQRMRARHAGLRRAWRRMPPEQRREMRRKYHEKMKERRAQLKENRDDRKEGNALQNGNQERGERPGVRERRRNFRPRRNERSR